MLSADQILWDQSTTTELKSGEIVVVDPELTVRKVYGVFYWCANVGSLSGLASVYMEKHWGFWTSFLMSLLSLMLGCFVLLLRRNKFCQFLSLSQHMPSLHTSENVTNGPRSSKARGQLSKEIGQRSLMRHQRWI